MAEDKIEKLIKRRSCMKSKLTIFSNHLNMLKSCSDISDSQLIDLENRLNKFDAIYLDFDKLQSDIEILAENPDDEIKEREQFENQFFKLGTTARRLLGARPSLKGDRRDSSVTRCDDAQAGSCKSYYVRLPKIDLPTFNGHYQHWLEFRDTFISLIHSRKDIDNINKLHYLRAALKDSALLIIDNLDYKAENYESAWSLLCSRYDNKRLLVNNHVHALFKVEPMQQECCTDIRRIIDITNKNLRALSTLDQPIQHWDTLIIHMMTEKLDSVTHRIWEEHRNTLTDPPTLNIFISFLSNRADLLETLQENKNNKTQKNAIYKSNNNYLTASDNKNYNNKNKYKNNIIFNKKKLKCLMCHQDHYLFNCETFRSLSIENRIQKAKESKVCLNCLRPGHTENICNLSSCKYCKKKHNTLLHLHGLDSVPVPAIPVNNINNLANSNVLQFATPPLVLLSTALVKVVDSMGNMHTARVLLDNGSTTNFVSQSFCGKLGLSRHDANSTVTDTQLRSLPPLYSLDDWTLCQKPGDVYCMVDAVLVSRSSSSILILLQEYSKQTLKHFNRTQVHRGVCVTGCGSREHTSGWHSAAQRCVNESLAKYGLEAEVLTVDRCKSVDAPATPSGSARALAALCTMILALACLASGVHFLGDRCDKAECNKYLLAFSLKRNWNILTYDRRQPRSDSRIKDVACLEGARVLGMQCVIFTHVLLIYGSSYIDNPHFVEKMYDQFGWQILFNSPLWLQIFFAMSGFLTAYTALLTATTSPFTVWKCLLSIINRWIRLTPAAMFVLWFTVAWLPLLGVGPQWSWLVDAEVAACSERWWYHVLYLHNQLHTGKSCMGHTWYIAADMQLHIAGVLLLLVLMKYRRAAAPVLLTLLAASAMAAGLMVYYQQLTPIITIQTPEVLRSTFASSVVWTRLLLPAWTNLPGYVCGIAVAFALSHHHASTDFKLNQNKWFGALFSVSLMLGGCVAVAGTVFLSDSPVPRWAAVLYAALDRTLVAVFTGIFMLGCFVRCKSAVCAVLEWRGFHPLGRLSYCVFLVHVIILRLSLANNTFIGHATILSLILLHVTTSVLSYVVALPLCLLVELPVLQLWKALIGSDILERRASTSPQLAGNPCDFVEQIRKRHAT